MLLFELSVSGPKSADFSRHATPQLQNTIPTQGADLVMLPDGGGQVLLRHLPAEREQAPQTRQGVS